MLVGQIVVLADLHRHAATRAKIAVPRNDPDEITLSLFLAHVLALNNSGEPDRRYAKRGPLRRFDLDQCANGDLVVGIMGRACMRGRGILLVQLGPPSWWPFFFGGRGGVATNRCLRKKMEELEGN